MKPSEQFADLKRVSDGLSLVDRIDLLALIELADRQFDIIREFGNCKRELRITTTKMTKHRKELQEWRERVMPMIKLEGT